MKQDQNTDMRLASEGFHWPSNRVREIDQRAIQEFGMSSLVLMENAGRGAAEWIDANWRSKKQPIPSSELIPQALLLCGTGNNGGDGLVIARHLDFFGWKVQVRMIGGPTKMSSDCRANYEILNRARFDLRWLSGQTIDELLVQEIESATVLVDALLGTGGAGAPRPPMSDVLARCNSSSAWKIAIDIPTGWNADEGKAGGEFFRADNTLTFATNKMYLPPETAGCVDVLPIGVPRRMLETMIEADSH